jgi:hypothetical protein
MAFVFFQETKDVRHCVKRFVDIEITKCRTIHSSSFFTIQADQGETRSQEIAEYVQSKGGEIRHSCAYSPEQQAMIERFWRTIAEMATAMLLAAKIGEPFWEDATQYATLIYNHTPRHHPGKTEMVSPVQLYTKEPRTMKHLQAFGCRAYVHIPSQIRRKNHKGRAEMGIFVGMEDSVINGYKFFRPLYRDYITSVHATFVPMSVQGSNTSTNTISATDSMSIPEGTLADFKYLENTYHLDEEDGLLYKTIKVVEEYYRKLKDRFVVGYRRMVLPNGLLSDKCDNESVHIRDIERMTMTTDMTVVDTLIPGQVKDQHRRLPGIMRSTTVPSDLGGAEKRAGSMAGSEAGGSTGRRVAAIEPQDNEKRVSNRKRKQPEFYQASHACDAEAMAATATSLEEEAWIPLDGLRSLGPETEEVIVQALQGDCLAAVALACSITLSSDSGEPASRLEAMESPDWPQWAAAEKTELDAMKRLNVISAPVPRPSGATLVKTKWLYKVKRDAQGNVMVFKARLVGQGYSQIFGKDYFDTYAPVARLSSLRLVYALSVVFNAQLYMLDVNTAFLNADLKEDVYINPPAGYGDVPKGLVLKLNKALYGLKQSPREWNIMITEFLVAQCKFVRLLSEHCIYIRHFDDGVWIIVLLYVDDIIIAHTSPDRFDEFKQMLVSRFQCKDIGKVRQALNIEVKYPKNGGLLLLQTKYINELVQKYSSLVENLSHACALPHDYHVKYCKEGIDCQSDIPCPDNDKISADTPYRALLGALLWVSEGTRPDIKYIISAMSRYLADPRVAHWKALKKVLRYLNGTKHLGIYYRPLSKGPKFPTGYVSSYNVSVTNLSVDGFVDADFANNLDDRRSITGYVFMMAGAPISWQSNSQKTVALSTMEAEYMALAAAVQESIWFRMLLEELKFTLQQPIRLYEDNVACIHFSDHPGEHRRSKHIDYRYHFVRERVHQGDVVVDSVQSQDNIADIYTKPLQRDLFLKLRNRMLSDGSQLQFE